MPDEREIPFSADEFGSSMDQDVQSFKIVPNLGSSLSSACRVLRDRNLRELTLGPGDLELNEMTKAIEHARSPVTEARIVSWRSRCEEVLVGTSERKLKTGESETQYKSIRFSADTTRDALLGVGSENSYHPVREYLADLDTTSATGAIFDVAGLLGQEGFGRELVRMWAIGCVARAYNPGCQLDHVLILVSPEQGRGKSSFFRAIAGDQWFSDTGMDLDNKDSYLQLHQNWIYEWGELAAFHGKSHERIKNFATSRVDSFRAPYAAVSENRPRTCVFVGTTNRTDFLSDITGERRWWPIRVSHIDIPAIIALRDRFWAEARMMFELGDQYWIDEGSPESKKLSELHHEEMKSEDPWEQLIDEWLITANIETKPLTTTRVLTDCLKMDSQRLTRGAQMRVADILRGFGFGPGPRQKLKGERFRTWKLAAEVGQVG